MWRDDQGDAASLPEPAQVGLEALRARMVLDLECFLSCNLPGGVDAPKVSPAAVILVPETTGDFRGDSRGDTEAQTS